MFFAFLLRMYDQKFEELEWIYLGHCVPLLLGLGNFLMLTIG